MNVNVASKSRQLPLSLPGTIGQGREDYFVGSSNEEAVSWIEGWPDQWTGVGLILYGPPKCGKTHLARVWQHQASARWIKIAHLTEALLTEVVKNSQPLIIDDADQFVPEQEELLFHLYNHCMSVGAHLLLTASKPPRQWDMALQDLRSRLLSVPSWQSSRQRKRSCWRC